MVASHRIRGIYSCFLEHIIKLPTDLYFTCGDYYSSLDLRYQRHEQITGWIGSQDFCSIGQLQKRRQHPSCALSCALSYEANCQWRYQGFLHNTSYINQSVIHPKFWKTFYLEILMIKLYSPRLDVTNADIYIWYCFISITLY